MNAANKKDGFSSKKRYQRALTIALPVALGIAVYINMLSNGFVFDDMDTIVHNDHIKDFGNSFPAFFNLDYFNTATSKVILDILVMFEEMIEEGNDVKVKWYYDEEDEDMQAAGEEYSDMVDVPIEMISVS